MIVRSTWSSCSDDVSALPSSWKTATSPASRRSSGPPALRRRSTAGNCLGSSTLGISCPLRTRLKAVLQKHKAVGSLVESALPGQYRHRVKSDATSPLYRRCHFAIPRYRTFLLELPKRQV